MNVQLISIGAERTVNSGYPVFAGSKYDNLSERLIFSGVPDLAINQSVFVAWTLNDGSESDASGLTKISDGWAWDVPAALTQFAGHGLGLSIGENVSSIAKQPVAVGYVHVTAVGGLLWNSRPFAILVASIPDATSTSIATDIATMMAGDGEAY